MQIRAPTIFLFSEKQLHDHCIGIEGDRVAYICPIADAPYDPDVTDLPHTTLLPGFVNAHCHMDLSHLRGRVPFTGSFADWVRSVLALRTELTWEAVRRAAQELQHSGVTTVCDHVGAFSELSYIIDTPFRKRLFMEVIGVTKAAATENWERQRNRAAGLRRRGISASTSPHAPYSCYIPSPLRGEGPGGGGQSIHCAESNEEWELITRGTGKLADFLRERGATCLSTATSPLQYLADHHLLSQHPWIAVHCNTVTDDDITMLKRSRATVVHCPRSHRFFNHPPFPLEKIRATGIPIRIGTDSLGSCSNFDFLEELRAMREEFPFLTTMEVLEMATQHADTGGARPFADIIGLRQQNDLLQGPVTFSMIGGRRVI